MRQAFRIGTLLAAGVMLAACTSTTERYADYTASLQANEKLRTDVDPADAPFDGGDLERNFVKIAMFSEYDEDLNAVPTETTLRRWEEPIRYRFIGKGVTADDRRQMRELSLRMTRLMGLKVEPIAKDANLLIMYLDAEERAEFNESAAEKWGEDFAEFNERCASSWKFPCIGRLFRKDSGEIALGLVFIKSEIEGLFRESCLHEEVIQSMGLTNDDPDVRPSIFNDDEEFALLTRHDEYLLQMLYDQRLKPGMSVEEVKPLLPEVVEDLLARNAS